VQNLTVTSYINPSIAAQVVFNPVASTCDNSTTLAPGANCTANFTITSRAGVESGSGMVGAKIQYNTLSNTNMLSVSALTSYQVYSDPFFVFVNESGIIQANYTMMTFGAGGAIATQKVWVMNTGNESGVMQSTAFESTVAPSTGSVLGMTANTCSNSLVLNRNESCFFVVQLGPKIALSTESGQNTYTISYTNGRFANRVINNGSESNVATFDWSVFGSNPDVTITAVTALPTQVSGIGTTGNPLLYSGALATSGIQQLKITYINTSTLLGIERFAVNTASLPAAWKVDPSSTCGYPSSPKTLAAAASCDLILEVDRPAIAYISNTSGIASLGFNYPSASWQVTEVNDGVNIESNFVFNGQNSFVGNYQSALVRTTFTPNNTMWTSTTAAQTITNAQGYNIKVTSIFQPTIESNVFSVAAGALCAITPSTDLTSLTCNYNTTALASGSATGVWTISLIDPANPLSTGNWLLTESAIDTSGNPIVYYNQYAEPLVRQ